jgi:hypothetical protein
MWRPALSHGFLRTRGLSVYHTIFIRNPILIKLGFTVAVKHTRVGVRGFKLPQLFRARSLSSSLSVRQGPIRSIITAFRSDTLASALSKAAIRAWCSASKRLRLYSRTAGNPIRPIAWFWHQKHISHVPALPLTD